MGYFGKPRSGKTTYLANYVRKNDRNKKLNKMLSFLPFQPFHVYDKIYSTDYIRGTYKINAYDIGMFKPQENSLILIPEGGVWFNNRLSKLIPKHCTDFFAMHGHYHCDIVWDSQSVDVDKKLRNRSERLYIVKKIGPWSVSTCIRYFIGVDNNTHDLVEGYKIPGFFGKVIDFVMGQYRILYRPNVYDYFDSWSDQCQWSVKHDKHIQPYADNGIRHTFLQKILPAVQLIGMLVAWIFALVFLYGIIF